MWYRYLYILALVACLLRGWRIRYDFPFWYWSMAASTVLTWRFLPESSSWLRSIWPYLLCIAPAWRALATMEAYARVMPLEFWSSGRTLSKGAHFLALGQVLIAASLVDGPAPANPLVYFGGMLKLWNALWFAMALAFMFLWPGLRRSMLAHSLVLEAVLVVEAGGAVSRFAAVYSTPWHAADSALYIAATVCMVSWCALVPAESAASQRDRATIAH